MFSNFLYKPLYFRFINYPGIVRMKCPKCGKSAIRQVATTTYKKYHTLILPITKVEYKRKCGYVWTNKRAKTQAF